jgi:transposase
MSRISRGTSRLRHQHAHASPKCMHRDLNKFAFRANHREMRNAMFDLLIASVSRWYR